MFWTPGDRLGGPPDASTRGGRAAKLAGDTTPDIPIRRGRAGVGVANIHHYDPICIKTQLEISDIIS